MTNKSMINILTTLGVEMNKWTFDNDITYIILEHRGNHYYDQFKQSIYFDTIKSLFKVKFYDSRLISGRLKVKEKQASAKYLIAGDKSGNVSTSLTGFERFREPVVGDYLFTIDITTLAAAVSSKIVSITKSGKDKIIETSADLDLTNKLLVYTTKEAIDGGLPQGEFARALPNDESIIIQYRPQTANIVDQYFGFSAISGFATVRDTTSPYSLL